MNSFREISITDFDSLSPVKKEKIKKEKIRARKNKLRADLPVLTTNEIRRFRLPYHEALQLELEENGFINTAEFIKQLIELQETVRNKMGPGTAVWSKPQLVNSKNDLDLLVSGLSKAEAAHNSNDFATECEEMFHLSAYYAFGPDDWWWLGEQLLSQCISMEYPEEFKKQEATINYLIGKYLVRNGKKADLGVYYLEIAREIAMGQSWNCKKILNEPQTTIFIESCRLIFKTLMEEIQNLVKTDPKRGIDVCIIARKRAAEACNHHGEFEAMILKGKCEMNVNDSIAAIGTVTKALHFAKRHKTLDGMCEAQISLALAYLKHGNVKQSLNCLRDLKKLAEQSNLNFYVAQAYRFMGEYYINTKQPAEATPLLTLAFYIFHDARDFEQREKARIWAALAAGQELFPAYINLIKKCDVNDTTKGNLFKLIKWIDENECFWTQQSKYSVSYTSLRESVQWRDEDILDEVAALQVSLKRSKISSSSAKSQKSAESAEKDSLLMHNYDY